MKRSRRVVLTLMGSAALTAAATRLAVARPVTCGPGFETVPGPTGPTCRVIPGGFGGSFHHFHGHGHGGHGHGGG
jgi:hypothetical protein